MTGIRPAWPLEPRDPKQAKLCDHEHPNIPGIFCDLYATHRSLEQPHMAIDTRDGADPTVPLRW